MTETRFDAGSVAEEIAAARAAGGRLAPFTDRIEGFGLEDAYRVAGILACRRAAGSPVVGRKIGFTNRALWEDAGLTEPVWGSMFEETVVRYGDGGTEKTQLSLDSATEPKIECEVVVVLGSAPEPGERGAAVARRIERVGLGFEVVDSPFPGWRMRPADSVAAGALHHALAVGEFRVVRDAEKAARALAALRVSMTTPAGGAPVAGAGSAVMGNPLDAVGVLAEITAAQGNPLRAGEVVTTGTLTPPLDCRPGERYSAEAEGGVLPPVAVELF